MSQYQYSTYPGYMSSGLEACHCTRYVTCSSCAICSAQMSVPIQVPMPMVSYPVPNNSSYPMSPNSSYPMSPPMFRPMVPPRKQYPCSCQIQHRMNEEGYNHVYVNIPITVDKPVSNVVSHKRETVYPTFNPMSVTQVVEPIMKAFVDNEDPIETIDPIETTVPEPVTQQETGKNTPVTRVKRIKKTRKEQEADKQSIREFLLSKSILPSKMALKAKMLSQQKNPIETIGATSVTGATNVTGKEIDRSQWLGGNTKMYSCVPSSESPESLSSDHRMMRVVGLDPGTTNVGLTSIVCSYKISEIPHLYKEYLVARTASKSLKIDCSKIPFPTFYIYDINYYMNQKQKKKNQGIIHTDNTLYTLDFAKDVLDKCEPNIIAVEKQMKPDYIKQTGWFEMYAKTKDIRCYTIRPFASLASKYFSQCENKKGRKYNKAKVSEGYKLFSHIHEQFLHCTTSDVQDAFLVAITGIIKEYYRDFLLYEYTQRGLKPDVDHMVMKQIGGGYLHDAHKEYKEHISGKYNSFYIEHHSIPIVAAEDIERFSEHCTLRHLNPSDSDV